MTCLKLAGIPVLFLNRYPYFSTLCADYRTEEAPRLSITVDEAEIEAERGACPPQLVGDAALGVAEALALYRRFSHELPLYDGFFLHAALLSVRGRGVAILAPSGVGKTTLATYLHTLLGEGCAYINGDKPLLRRQKDGAFLGYGTPFCGKEGLGQNTAVPLSALLFLERGEENSILPLSPSEAFPLFFAAALAPKSEEELARLLPLLSACLAGVRSYRLAARNDISAARLVLQTLREGE